MGICGFAQDSQFLTKDGKWESYTTSGDVISGTGPTTVWTYKCEYGELMIGENDSWQLQLNRKYISGAKINPSKMYNGNLCADVIIALLDSKNKLLTKYEDLVATGDIYSRLNNIVPKKKKKDKKGALVVNQYLKESQGAVVIRFATMRDKVFDFYIPCIKND